MAKKINALQLAQESRGRAEVTDRQPATESAALSLMPLRLPKWKVYQLKRKLPVVMDDETRDQMEHPVKIRHSA